ncbi:glycosyltransferase family 2 protein [Kineococcus rubinsiae]|uniref:glycosyltransferase family 2 protein n=1 Tax=Kineococcus rubinsiae TaxID=2609562 RepID=UPI00143037A5|nr:glycosyltransferase family 2 protein [Kineococcus rubinsiae]
MSDGVTHAAEPVASVVVRTFDSAATLEATLTSVRAQDVPAEVVVVDSGSTDATLGLADALADRVVHVPRGEFTYGGALNAGAAAATTDVHVALSSHCVLPDPAWLRTAVSHLHAGATAAVGLTTDAHGVPLDGPVAASHEYVLAHPWWGFSNHASAWRADAWRHHRFDESLSASEDKEWTWRALAGAGPLVVDQRLVVVGVHRRSGGAASYYRRLVKEVGATHHLRPLPGFGLREAVLDWVRPTPHDPYLSSASRLGRTRAIEVAARWDVDRRTRRAGGPEVPGFAVPVCAGGADAAACPVPSGLRAFSRS